MTASERPGVYTSYEVTSALSARGGAGCVGLVALASSGTAGKCEHITSYAQAVSAFGADCNLTKLVRVLLRNGAPRIIAVPSVTSGAAASSDYALGFSALMQEREVGFMVCDSRLPAVHALMKSAIQEADSEAAKYRIGIVEGTGTAAQLISAAAALNSERMVLAAPSSSSALPGAVAAALAAAAAASSDPALPLNGSVLYEIDDIGGNFTDNELDALVRGGVSVVESVGGETSLVRAVTTRTTTAGATDATWRELSTILIVDHVIPLVRDSLRSRFTRVKNTEQTRGAIRTQVLIELEALRSAEIIDSYGEVRAEADEADPTTCRVSFEFTVAHGLNRIQLVACITV